ncbi:hypothetical protein RJ639_027159 [Escallonia herrerae]|uniref:Uncharacterized protein n=1 Tax=Escallonia herrerae TaxID=1293975 RepID=A0AA88X5V0_9ASTE|nr:hypothetical protein RJ639_027159 [Escallonia herrerae]
MVLSEHQTLDWSDRLYLLVYQKTSESLNTGLKSQNLSESEKEIEPAVEGLVDDKRLRLYKKVKHYVGSYFQ